MKDSNTQITPETTLTEVEPTLASQLHDAIESFVDFEGREEASRNLHVAAGMIAHVEREMPQLADKHVKYALGDAGYKSWRDDGRTYACFARLVGERLDGQLNGEAV